jgi:hypothetical protein
MARVDEVERGHATVAAKHRGERGMTSHAFLA